MFEKPYSVLVSAAVRPPEYFSGVFDGEGCIRILRNFSKKQQRYYYCPRLVVHMANLPILRAFAARFGGRVTFAIKPPPGHKQQWMWQRSRPDDVRRVLDTIRPWLIEKADQADEMYRYLNQMDRLGRKAVDHHKYYLTLRLLKRAA